MNKKSIGLTAIGWASLVIGLLAFTAPTRAASDAIIYADALASGWVDTWSWNTNRNLNNSSPVHSGSAVKR